MPSPRCLLVTGRLAEPAMRAMAARLKTELSLDYAVEVLPISVAALMHVDWVRRKLTVPEGTERVLLPGWCQGDVTQLSAEFGVPVELGPKDLQDLPEHFSQKKRAPPDLSVYDIEILAEINHAPRMDEAKLIAEAERFRASGADVIDLGCIPGETWSRAGAVTRVLRDRGLRVSIDSFNRAEVEASVASGAELVLSCNSTNIDWAAELSAELVAIPDDPHDLSSLEPTIERLTARGAKFRIDPILEPIGFGFSASLGRYLEARRRWPELPVMMGIGNLTELTEVDSAGVNMLLAGFCQEQRIGSVLTTEVIPWCRTAVREFDIARRIVAHALRTGTLPKHVDPSLVMLRDPKVREQGAAVLKQIAAQLRDPNYRIFAEGGALHIMNRDGHHQGTDPFELFDRLQDVDASHAFYLGYELAKAMTALTLGKQYTQDEALNWGFLTRPEESALHRRKQSP
jgi:dihydropteroate synthase-like protein